MQAESEASLHSQEDGGDSSAQTLERGTIEGEVSASPQPSNDCASLSEIETSTQHGEDGGSRRPANTASGSSRRRTHNLRIHFDDEDGHETGGTWEPSMAQGTDSDDHVPRHVPEDAGCVSPAADWEKLRPPHSSALAIFPAEVLDEVIRMLVHARQQRQNEATLIADFTIHLQPWLERLKCKLEKVKDSEKRVQTMFRRNGISQSNQQFARSLLDRLQSIVLSLIPIFNSSRRSSKTHERILDEDSRKKLRLAFMAQTSIYNMSGHLRSTPGFVNTLFVLWAVSSGAVQLGHNVFPSDVSLQAEITRWTYVLETNKGQRTGKIPMESYVGYEDLRELFENPTFVIGFILWACKPVTREAEERPNSGHGFNLLKRAKSLVDNQRGSYLTPTLKWIEDALQHGPAINLNHAPPQVVADLACMPKKLSEVTNDHEKIRQRARMLLKTFREAEGKSFLGLRSWVNLAWDHSSHYLKPYFIFAGMVLVLNPNKSTAVISLTTIYPVIFVLIGLIRRCCQLRHRVRARWSYKGDLNILKADQESWTDKEEREHKKSSMRRSRRLFVFQLSYLLILSTMIFLLAKATSDVVDLQFEEPEVVGNETVALPAAVKWIRTENNCIVAALLLPQLHVVSVAAVIAVTGWIEGSRRKIMNIRSWGQLVQWIHPKLKKPSALSEESSAEKDDDEDVPSVESAPLLKTPPRGDVDIESGRSPLPSTPRPKLNNECIFVRRSARIDTRGVNAASTLLSGPTSSPADCDELDDDDITETKAILRRAVYTLLGGGNQNSVNDLGGLRRSIDPVVLENAEEHPDLITDPSAVVFSLLWNEMIDNLLDFWEITLQEAKDLKYKLAIPSIQSRTRDSYIGRRRFSSSELEEIPTDAKHYYLRNNVACQDYCILDGPADLLNGLSSKTVKDRMLAFVNSFLQIWEGHSFRTSIAEMSSRCVLIPRYSEEIILSTSMLMKVHNTDQSLLYKLIQMHRKEWGELVRQISEGEIDGLSVSGYVCSKLREMQHMISREVHYAFKEFVNPSRAELKADESLKEVVFLIQKWASLRHQTLARITYSLHTHVSATQLLARMESEMTSLSHIRKRSPDSEPSPVRHLTGPNVHRIDATAAEIVTGKLRFIVAHQQFQARMHEDDHIFRLMRDIPQLQVAVPSRRHASSNCEIPRTEKSKIDETPVLDVSSTYNTMDIWIANVSTSNSTGRNHRWLVKIASSVLTDCPAQALRLFLSAVAWKSLRDDGQGQEVYDFASELINLMELIRTVEQIDHKITPSLAFELLENLSDMTGIVMDVFRGILPDSHEDCSEEAVMRTCEYLHAAYWCLNNSCTASILLGDREDTLNNEGKDQLVNDVIRGDRLIPIYGIRDRKWSTKDQGRLAKSQKDPSADVVVTCSVPRNSTFLVRVNTDCQRIHPPRGYDRMSSVRLVFDPESKSVVVRGVLDFALHNLVIGSGKSANQNLAVPYCYESVIQAIDTSQDYPHSEAMTTCNFVRSLARHSAVSTVGCPEYVISKNFSHVSSSVAHSELVFTGPVQRGLSMYGCRLFYGHPDIFRTSHVRTFLGIGDMSYVSEDVAVGYRALQFGYCCDYVDGHRVGKGKDVGTLTSFKFNQKIAGGSAEICQSRLYSRVYGRRKTGTWGISSITRHIQNDILYAQGPGFFLNSVLTMLLVLYTILFALTEVAISAAGVQGTSSTTGMGDSMILWGVVILVELCGSLAYRVPRQGVIQGALRTLLKLPLQAVVFLSQMFARADAFFSQFSSQGAAYIGTGRDAEIAHQDFYHLYQCVRKSHVRIPVFSILAIVLYFAVSPMPSTSVSIILVAAILSACSMFVLNPGTIPHGVELDTATRLLAEDWRSWKVAVMGNSRLWLLDPSGELLKFEVARQRRVLLDAFNSFTRRLTRDSANALNRAVIDNVAGGLRIDFDSVKDAKSFVAYLEPQTGKEPYHVLYYTLPECDGPLKLLVLTKSIPLGQLVSCRAKHMLSRLCFFTWDVLHKIGLVVMGGLVICITSLIVLLFNLIGIKWGSQTVEIEAELEATKYRMGNRAELQGHDGSPQSPGALKDLRRRANRQSGRQMLSPRGSHLHSPEIWYPPTPPSGKGSAPREHIARGASSDLRQISVTRHLFTQSNSSAVMPGTRTDTVPPLQSVPAVSSASAAPVAPAPALLPPGPSNVPPAPPPPGSANVPPAPPPPGSANIPPAPPPPGSSNAPPPPPLPPGPTRVQTQPRADSRDIPPIVEEEDPRLKSFDWVNQLAGNSGVVDTEKAQKSSMMEDLQRSLVERGAREMSNDPEMREQIGRLKTCLDDCQMNASKYNELDEICKQWQLIANKYPVEESSIVAAFGELDEATMEKLEDVQLYKRLVEQMRTACFAAVKISVPESKTAFKEVMNQFDKLNRTLSKLHAALVSEDADDTGLIRLREKYGIRKLDEIFVPEWAGSLSCDSVGTMFAAVVRGVSETWEKEYKSFSGSAAYEGVVKGLLTNIGVFWRKVLTITKGNPAGKAEEKNPEGWTICLSPENNEELLRIQEAVQRVVQS